MTFAGSFLTNRLAQMVAIVRQNLGRSLAALVIKIATAGLAYVMFVALSRSMDVAAYGQFAFGFSLATMLAIVAGLGQHMVIVRLWPEEQAAGRGARALIALRSGWALTLLAGLGTSFVLALVTLVLGLVSGTGTDFSYLYGAALLVLPMAAAEYGSAALRAQGSVFTALTPRDILWRVSVPVAVWLLYMNGVQFNGLWALGFVALVLAAVLGVQYLLGLRRYANGIDFSQLSKFWVDHRGLVVWVWIATILDSAALNLDVVLVGAVLSPEASGLFLNAFRTAGLMTLFLFAINQVAAPLVSRHFHGGDIEEAQSIVSFTAWGGFIFALGVFVLFVLFGPLIMGLFGPEYASGSPILLILAAGLMVDAATGPTRIVMMMTGHERAYVAIIAATSVVALLLALSVIPFFGIVGAAIVNALARVTTQIVLVWHTRRAVGMDPSILAAFFKPGGRAAHG
jgi:O-antigen/teichoic acid export membrane protein